MQTPSGKSQPTHREQLFQKGGMAMRKKLETALAVVVAIGKVISVVRDLVSELDTTKADENPDENQG